MLPDDHQTRTADGKRPSSSAWGGISSGSTPTKKGKRQEFSRGAIVLIKVSDFMTYTGTVIIEPGPRLNLVLGPNGTGKSSLVCAMCIGLAGSPKVLGRGDNVKEFVRRGCRHAWTEITLSGGPGAANFKVRRDIKLKEGSMSLESTPWKLNDRDVKLADIKQLVADLGIQFDNLCQFLPQDRVVEFARMSPTELLAGTQKAIEDGALYQQHQRLIVQRSALKQAEIKRSGTASQLDKLRTEQGRQQRDYEKYQQRNHLEKQIAVIRRKVVHVELDAKKRSLREAQQDLSAAQAVHRAREEEAHADNTPIKRKEAEIKKVAAEVGRRTQRLTQLNQAYGAACEKLRDQIAVADEKIDQVLNLAAESETHRKAIDLSRRTVHELVAEVQQADAATNGQGYTTEDVAQLTELTRMRADVEEQVANMTAELQEMSQREVAIANEVRRLEATMLKYSDERQQRLRKLEQRNPGITDAHNWVQANQAEFRDRVYGPVLVELSNVDSQYAAALEQQLGQHLSYFITSCPADEQRLTEQMRTYRNAPANVACFVGDYHQPIRPTAGAAHSHAQYGITHTLDQVFEAPSVIKHALCNLVALNSIYIGTEETARVMDELTARTGVRTVFTPLGRHTFVQSRYNQQAKGNTVEGLRSPVLLSGQGDQEDGQRRVQMDTLSRRQEEYQEVRAEVERQKAEVQRRRDSVQQLQNRQQAIRSAGVEVVNRRVQLKARLSRAQRDLTVLQMKPDPSEQEPQFVAARQEAIHTAVQEAKAVQSVLSEQWRDAQVVLATQLALKELEMQKDAMESASKRAQAAVLEAEKAVRLVEAHVSAARADKKRAQDKVDAFGPLDATTASAFDVLPQDDGELQELLAQTQDELDGITCNMADVTAYMDRAQKIEDGDADLAQQDHDLAVMARDLTDLKAEWLPTLLELVNHVNGNFGDSLRQMGCVGEVALREHEDFDKYAIVIKVKFRDEEELQVLTATRQSGGERSVCTILYLIALQGVANTPFRVVDEINQGMDPVNERKVFGLLMNSSMEPDTPQCFLLTPKLLPNLPFRQGLTVLSIVSGAGIDADVPAHINTEDGLYGSRYHERPSASQPVAVR